MRTKARRHAPLIRCNARERPTAIPAQDHRLQDLRTTGVLGWQEQTIWKAGRTWAASMAVRPACRSLRTEARRSRVSFATSEDRNSQRTMRALNTSAGKIGATIHLAIRNSDSPFDDAQLVLVVRSMDGIVRRYIGWFFKTPGVAAGDLPAGGAHGREVRGSRSPRRKR